MKPLEPLLPGETRSEYLDRLAAEEHRGYCQPDSTRGCARMTLKRWFGKCPDCPCLDDK